MTKVNSLTKNDDHINSISKDNSNLLLKNCKFSNVDYIKIKNITHDKNKYENDYDSEKLGRVVEDRVFEDSKNYNKVLNKKGQHYLEQSVGVYPKFKDFPNQVFVTKGNYDKIDQRFISMVNKDNMKVTYAGLYST